MQLNVVAVQIFSQKFFVCLDLYVQFRAIGWDSWRSAKDIKELAALSLTSRRDWLFHRVTAVPAQQYRVYFLRYIFRVFE